MPSCPGLESPGSLWAETHTPNPAVPTPLRGKRYVPPVDVQDVRLESTTSAPQIRTTRNPKRQGPKQETPPKQVPRRVNLAHKRVWYLIHLYVMFTRLSATPGLVQWRYSSWHAHPWPDGHRGAASTSSLHCPSRTSPSMWRQRTTLGTTKQWASGRHCPQTEAHHRSAITHATSNLRRSCSSQLMAHPLQHTMVTPGVREPSTHWKKAKTSTSSVWPVLQKNLRDLLSRKFDSSICGWKCFHFLWEILLPLHWVFLE